MQDTILWPRKGQQDELRTAEVMADLMDNSESLFSPPDGEVEIAVAEVTPKGTEKALLESEGDIREHLSTHHPSAISLTLDAAQKDELDHTPRSSFFLVEPAYAWSNLRVTRDGILTLFAGLGVFCHIYRHLKAFGIKAFAKDESFAGFDSATTLSRSGRWASFESCYLLKYIGRKEETNPNSHPWSIRHALIYQKVNVETERSSHILVRLPEQVIQQLGDCIKGEESEAVLANDWTLIHALCFSSVDAEFRNMVNYVDEEVTKVFDRVIMSGVEPTKLNKFDSVQSSTRDLKRLQFLSDQARRAINAIELNMDTMKCLQARVDFLTTVDDWGRARSSPLNILLQNLAKCQEEHQFALKNASAVLDRAIATSQQLRDTVSLRNSEISKLNAETTSQNTLAIAHLADHSSRETHVVKTLTVLALVFVPASFVADFLQMGFITIAQQSPMRWKAEPDLKIYAVLAIPLIATTMLIYGCVEVMQRLKGRKKPSSKGSGLIFTEKYP